MTRALRMMSLAGFALLAACDPSSTDLAKDGALTSAPYTTAAEFAALLQTGGEIVCQSGSATFSLTQPNQSVGMPLTLDAGDVVHAETSGNPLLDTTLFLFGPDDGNGFYGELPVAMDDDSAGAGHARLVFTIKDAGDYILVVSTYKGEGVGDATVQLSVNAQAGCESGAPPTSGDVCTTLMTCAQTCGVNYTCIQTCQESGCQSARETSQAVLACTFTNCAASCVADPHGAACLACIATYCSSQSEACFANRCDANAP